MEVSKVSARENQALALINKGQYREAEVIYRDLIKSGSKNFIVYGNLGALLKLRGDLKNAIWFIKKSLELFPSYPDGHNNLGIALKEQGQLIAAIHSYRKALELKPDFPEAHHNLGIALQETGDLSGAISSYTSALKLQPIYPDACFNMAVALSQQGNLHDAITFYNKLLALCPDYIEAYINLGIIFQANNDIDSAISSFKDALKIDPNCVKALNGMGNAFHSTGDITAAISFYKMSLGLEPNCADTVNNLGNAYLSFGDTEKAVDYYNKAVDLKPDCYDAHYNLGVALQEKGLLSDSMNAYKRAVSLNPREPNAHNNIAALLHEQGDLEEATFWLKRSLQISPDHAESYNTLGNIFKDRGEFCLAVDSYRRAFALKPDFFDAELNISLCMLLLGDYKNGWEKYESRSKIAKEPVIPHSLPYCDQWKGEVLDDGSQLLVVTEQGLGDFIQFIRYVKPLRDSGLRISICSPRRLHPLIAASDLDANPLSPGQGNIVKNGKWSPLLSLPRYLNVSPKNPLVTSPYIRSTPALNSKWNDALRHSNLPIIGINWRGNRTQDGKKNRNISFSDFLRITDRSYAQFVCLQRGVHKSELGEIGNLPFTLSSHQRQIFQIADSDMPDDFLEYAAIISNCDLVITSGSTVAHLAAALGIKTWVLLPQSPDWRWGIEGDKSFWYPTMRLFRQQQRGCWDDVIRNVACALIEYLND